MSVIIFLSKMYIVVLLFRLVCTKQELIFNPTGKIIGKLTNPILPKTNANKIIALLILGLVVITSILASISTNSFNFLINFKKILIDYVYFFMIFFIIAIIFGSFGNRPIGGGIITLFFRLGLPWVKLTRIFIPINSGKIIFPSIIVLYVLSVCLIVVIATIFNVIIYESIGNILKLFVSAMATGTYHIFGLMYYMSFIIVFRALLSWVSPDPNNFIVQLIYIITEPILEPLRKVIPPVGFFDFSAFVAVLGLYFGGRFLQSLVIPFIF